ncbi:MAG: molybdopterin-dependent oxidoreductase [Frankiales bacterium]|nr:molybdopterin-dependent oxidoreductase [Frankiales bacterium]
MVLPPGQRRIDGFPRFGIHFGQPPPEVPDDPCIEIGGAVARPVVVRLEELRALPRRELVADLHCVAGWSATGLRWEGVPFATFYGAFVEPALAPGATISHLSIVGADSYRSVVTIEDALGADVLLADRLDGRPLDGDHGAPIRFVSPSQYGFINTKHLRRIEVHTSEPPLRYHPTWWINAGLHAVMPHERARVWHEERHRYLPAWALRPVYRRLIPALKRLSTGR